MNLKVMAHGAANVTTKRLSGAFWIRRKHLEKSQWLSHAELEQLQLKYLKALIAHCYETVPYYHNIMDEKGIKVKSIKTLYDIERFPVMTKKNVLQAGNLLISTKYPKWLLHTSYTGGTTGPRLPLKRDLWSIGNEHAFVRRQFDWCGITTSDCCAYLTWRRVVGPNEISEKLYAYDPFCKELILSTFHLSEKTAKDYAEIMRKYKVKALVAYPSAAFVLASAVLKSGTTLPLHKVLTTSENLGEHEKATISQAFESPVCDFYGSAERVCYIHTCEYGSYHIIPEYGITELIQHGDDIDCRRIIATGFWNRAMPLIRYDTEDLVKTTDRICPCGRTFTVIEKIIGRQSKTITTSTGRKIGITAMGRLFKNALLQINEMPIAQSQFILEEDGAVCFEYVPGDIFTIKDENILELIIRQELPDDLEIRIRQTSHATTTSSGKSVSLVKG